MRAAGNLVLGFAGVVAAWALAGCSIDVKPPAPSSITELKRGTLNRIDEFDKAIAEDKVHADQVKQLAASINWLRGHLKSTGVGTPEQLEALDQTLYHLARNSGSPGGPPADWVPSKDAKAQPKPIIESGPIKELLPQIRRIVESIPDSDARPEGRTGLTTP